MKGLVTYACIFKNRELLLGFKQENYIISVLRKVTLAADVCDRTESG